MSDEEDEYEIPLQDQRVFGAGIKRKRVRFVPSSDPSTTNPPSPPSRTATSVADRYLSLVLPSEAQLESSPSSTRDQETAKPLPSLCDICNLPLDEPSTSSSSAATPSTRPHASSLAHQVCLPHSHPPSHIDRSRKGLSILSAYGWDPDSRRGLGSEGQGIQFPIKAKAKDDKLGLGVVVPTDKELLRRMKKKDVKLDAGKVRKMAELDKRKRERLQEMFYGNDDVERYLRK